jgi:hypothetical protein
MPADERPSVCQNALAGGRLWANLLFRLGVTRFKRESMIDRNTSRATKTRLHETGLPQFDEVSFNKGLSDEFRGNKWWPAAGTEPLSYTAGYQEAGVHNPRTESDPRADPSQEPTPPDRVTESRNGHHYRVRRCAAWGCWIIAAPL